MRFSLPLTKGPLDTHTADSDNNQTPDLLIWLLSLSNFSELIRKKNHLISNNVQMERNNNNLQVSKRCPLLLFLSQVQVYTLDILGSWEEKQPHYTPRTCRWLCLPSKEGQRTPERSKNKGLYLRYEPNCFSRPTNRHLLLSGPQTISLGGKKALLVHSPSSPTPLLLPSMQPKRQETRNMAHGIELHKPFHF